MSSGLKAPEADDASIPRLHHIVSDGRQPPHGPRVRLATAGVSCAAWAAAPLLAWQAGVAAGAMIGRGLPRDAPTASP